MSDVPPLDGTLKGYQLAFLTDQWEWEAELAAGSLAEAKAAARAALEALVRDERPELACVTLVDHGLKVGVWDWVAGKAYWSRL